MRPKKDPFAKGQVVTEQALTKKFDRFAADVLSDTVAYLKELDRKKGQRRKYKIVKELPDAQEYGELRDNHYTYSIKALVTGGIDEIISVKDELQEWYDSMPENLQGADKGQQLEQCVGELDQIEEPEIPARFEDIFCVCLPAKTNGTGRGSRLAEAARELEVAMDALAKIPDYEKDEEIMNLHDAVLREAIDAARAADPPGMY